MKKRNLLALALLMGASPLVAGEAVWQTDFEKAKEEAAARKVPILANFSGSDWCGWCIRLDREVVSKPEFQAYAGTNLVLFLADFPNSKPQPEAVAKQNDQLSERYRVAGFPTVLLLDATGKEMARTGYRPGGPDAYVDHLKSLVREAKPAISITQPPPAGPAAVGGKES